MISVDREERSLTSDRSCIATSASYYCLSPVYKRTLVVWVGLALHLSMLRDEKHTSRRCFVRCFGSPNVWFLLRLPSLTRSRCYTPTSNSPYVAVVLLHYKRFAGLFLWDFLLNDNDKSVFLLIFQWWFAACQTTDKKGWCMYWVEWKRSFPSTQKKWDRTVCDTF